MRRPSHTATSALLAAFLVLLPVPAIAQGSISSDIQRAETLIAQGDYVEALAAVRSASTQAPSDYRVRYYSGMALLGLQRFDEARTETELALSLAPGDEKAGVQRLLAAINLQSVSLTAEADAEAALAAGLTGRAARLFAQAFEADNTKTEAGFRAATLYTGSLSQPVEAVKVLRKIEAQSADGAARVKAKQELDKLTPVVRPAVDELLIKAKASIDAGNVSGVADQLASAAALDPERRELIIEQLRFSALGNDARAVEAAFLQLATAGISIESIIPVLPKGQFWADQPWLSQLLQDYQGTTYAERIIRFLRGPRSIKDCNACPELVVLPPGRFVMGHTWTPGDFYSQSEADPPREVKIENSFAISKFEITFDQYKACVASGGCSSEDNRFGIGGSSPFMYADWQDAQNYVAWLSKVTRQTYRLLSEAEWEYAARAGTVSVFYWGDNPKPQLCDTSSVYGINAGCPNGSSMPVGSFAPNPWGIHDLYGRGQWVEDCYMRYDQNPQLKSDGSAYTKTNCATRVLRGFHYWLGSFGRADLAGAQQYVRVAREIRE